LNPGIIGLVNQGEFRKPDEWGTLRAWSWGPSKALDYLQTEKSINPKQIGIEGHSRWGKTAMLAAAMDTRYAIVFSSCSGSGGASLEKRNFGENLGVIAGESEYHWMAPNFVKYGGDWQALPVDAHDMMALIDHCLSWVGPKTFGPIRSENLKLASRQRLSMSYWAKRVSPHWKYPPPVRR